jgi:hypothetical protein
MGIPSGLGAQLMFGEETVYGTAVTPTRTFEFVNEKLKMDIDRVESKAVRQGQRFLRSDRWAAGKKDVGGDSEFEVANKSFGILFKHMFGGVATTQPDNVGAPTVYKHTFTPGDLPMSLTGQVGRPDVGGTVRPFTYHGLRISDWELSCAVGEILGLKTSFVGQDEETATALATPAYPASLNLLTFVQGTLTLGGSPQDIKSFSAKGVNGLADDRYFMGSQLRKQPLEAKMRDCSGQLEAEFESLTAYTRFTAGTEAQMVLLFQGDLIASTFHYEAKLTANVRFDGQTPAVGGAEIIQQTLPYKVVDNGTLSVKLEYQTTDTTP